MDEQGYQLLWRAEWEGVVGPGDSWGRGLFFLSVFKAAYKSRGFCIYFPKWIDKSKIGFQTLLFLFVLENKFDAPQLPTINTNTLLFLCRMWCNRRAACESHFSSETNFLTSCTFKTYCLAPRATENYSEVTHYSQITDWGKSIVFI